MTRTTPHGSTIVKLGNRSATVHHDPVSDVVRIRTWRRMGSRESRRRVVDGALAVSRADLRALCDALHDFADDLDRQHRDA